MRPSLPAYSTPLAAIIARRIRYGTPVSIADYMRECLTHPEHGFYSRSSDLKAHFLTSPDIGQVFGELIGAWAASFRPHRLIELGAGSGNLLKHATSTMKSGGRLERLDILESSRALRKMQKDNLGLSGCQVHWHDTITSVLEQQKKRDESAPAVIIAHEFFDALPVHVFRAQEGGQWREVLIDVDSNGESDALHLSLSKGPTLASVTASKLLASWEHSGKTAEISFDALGIAEKIALHISAHGGAAIFVDYHTHITTNTTTTTTDTSTDTLRAYFRHAQVNILDNPGLCDITYDVNFDHMKRVVDKLNLPLKVHGPVSQRLFLLRLGIAHRFRKLAMGVIENDRISTKEKDRRLEALQANYHRLVDANMMGEKFGVFAITKNDVQVPEGFR